MLINFLKFKNNMWKDSEKIKSYLEMDMSYASADKALKRAIKELSDLYSKWTKLSTFLNTDKFNELPFKQRHRLCLQQKYMQKYMSILFDRLQDWGK